MSAILDGNLRIVYFAEIFPSASETWVHHEIDELQRLGCTVKVFATQARPSSIPRELEHFLDITTYLPELPRSAFQALCRILNYNLIRKVAAGILFDAKGIRLKAQVLRDLLFTGYLSPLVAEFRPDYVFAHFAGTRTNLAMFHSLLLRVPFGFKMHAYDVFNRVSLFRLKVSMASNIFTISNYNVNYIAEHYPDIDASRIQVHRCGIPLDHNDYCSSRVEAPAPLFLAVGRLVAMKGFDVLLQASSWLRD